MLFPVCGLFGSLCGFRSQPVVIAKVCSTMCGRTLIVQWQLTRALERHVYYPKVSSIALLLGTELEDQATMNMEFTARVHFVAK